MDPRFFSNASNGSIPQPNHLPFINHNGWAPVLVAEQRGLPSQGSTQVVFHGAPPTPINTWSIQQPPYTANDNQVSRTHTSQRAPQCHVLAAQATATPKRKRLDSINMDTRNAKERRTLDNRSVREGPFKSQLMPQPRTQMQAGVHFPVGRTTLLVPDTAHFLPGLGFSTYLLSDPPNPLAWIVIILAGQSVFDYLHDLPTPSLGPDDHIVLGQGAGVTAGIRLDNMFLLQVSHPVSITELPLGFQCMPAVVLPDDRVRPFVQNAQQREWMRRKVQILDVKTCNVLQASQDGTVFDPEDMYPSLTSDSKPVNSSVDAQRSVPEPAKQAKVSPPLEQRQMRPPLNADSGRPLWPTRPGSGLPPLVDGQGERVRRGSGSGQDTFQQFPTGGRARTKSWGVGAEC